MRVTRCRLAFGNTVYGRPDAHIGAAAAKVAAHCVIDLRIGRARIARQKRSGAHDLPRLAVTALRDVQLHPGLLDGVRAVFGQPFDRGDGSAFGAR